MTESAVIETPAENLEPIEALRAAVYGLLATLLRQAPDEAMLGRLRAIAVDAQPDDALAAAWQWLREAAQKSDTQALTREFFTLFVGLGRGELVPYGSWYLSGALMERPLVALRSTLAELGLARDEQVSEPEDHASAVLEAMALIIQRGDSDIEAERGFFSEHIGAWMDQFFSDLENAQAADFYRTVGILGRVFLDLEKEAFALEPQVSTTQSTVAASLN